MGIFGQDVNINVNRDVNTNNDKETNTPVITRAAVRQQRKLEKENHIRELDKQYRELAYAKYDTTNPKQIVHTMTQLAAFYSSCGNAYAQDYKITSQYTQVALSNLKTGIDLLKSIDPSNPMIAHFEQKVAGWEKGTRMKYLIIAFLIILLIAVLIIGLALK